LIPKLKEAIIDAYVASGRASGLGQAAMAKKAVGMSHSISGAGSGDLAKAFRKCEKLLQVAHSLLEAFWGHGG